jgi:integrase
MHAERTANRKVPKYASHLKRNATKRKAKPQRAPADRYNVSAYGHAIAKAVDRANAAHFAEHGPNLPPVPRWAPNQLRHAFGTDVRRRFGLEAAQVVLGHSRADVTQVYAERDQGLAERVAAEVG